MRNSSYLIEPHAPWQRGWQGKDIVTAPTDSDALKQARLRCASGDLYRYTHRPGDTHGLLYVARFFKWEQR